ncbi:hypothetical protein CN212_34820 [Sinorhizobium meliloti]|nr:hypothetical protein CN220_34045 [Sinorhizobium meliloti]RVH38248.1 hypothetical protein CN212_34820 [Sinorhizobium meliloti]
MSAFSYGQYSVYDRNEDAMLPFTDLSVDVALGVDGIVLPQARHGGLVRCSPFGPIRSNMYRLEERTSEVVSGVAVPVTQLFFHAKVVSVA